MMARPTLTRHPKFLRLVRMLEEQGFQEPEAVALGALLFLREHGDRRGNVILGDQLDVELAAHCRARDGKLCAALLECGFIKKVPKGPHETRQRFLLPPQQREPD